MKYSFLFLILFTFCGKEESYVIKDERWYMGELKRYAGECARRNNQIDENCLNKKIKKNIPSKYYVHVRTYKDDKGNIGWEFACIDTTRYGHEEELEKALKTAAGY